MTRKQRLVSHSKLQLATECKDILTNVVHKCNTCPFDECTAYYRPEMNGWLHGNGRRSKTESVKA